MHWQYVLLRNRPIVVAVAVAVVCSQAGDGAHTYSTPIHKGHVAVVIVCSQAGDGPASITLAGTWENFVKFFTNMSASLFAAAS